MWGLCVHQTIPDRETNKPLQLIPVWLDKRISKYETESAVAIWYGTEIDVLSSDGPIYSPACSEILH